MDKTIARSVSDFLDAANQQHSGLITAYLFGSYAKGQQSSDSDIDVALVIEHLADEAKFDLQVQLMLLAARFDSRIEPHPLSMEDFQAGNPFAAEIKRTGVEMKFRRTTDFA